MDKDPLESQKHTIRLWVFAAISILFLTLPFFFTSFPPATDLPQHLCQIYLLTETLKGSTDLIILIRNEFAKKKNTILCNNYIRLYTLVRILNADEFKINWFAPNNLIYLLLAGFKAVFDPSLAGKALLIIIVLMWSGSTYFLAWKLHRPIENAIITTLLIFNLSLYWGFLNFLIGWPFFVIFLVQSLKPMDKKNWSFMFILLILLFGCHALWFLVSSVFLFIHTFFIGRGLILFFIGSILCCQSEALQQYGINFCLQHEKPVDSILHHTGLTHL